MKRNIAMSRIKRLDKVMLNVKYNSKPKLESCTQTSFGELDVLSPTLKNEKI